MKSKLTMLALILLAATSAAFSQTIEHAPTAEQCRADMAVWKAAAKSSADLSVLPVQTLMERSQYLTNCNRVLSDVKDDNAAEWALLIRGGYDSHIAHRAFHFIDRRGLAQQFYREDAKGSE